jgi:Spy/CpxP family protein refolding chaperone
MHVEQMKFFPRDFFTETVEQDRSKKQRRIDMKSAKLISLLSVIMVVAFVATAGAQCWRGNGGFAGKGGPMAKLTPEQRQKVQSLRLEFLKKTEPIRSEMRKKRIEMMELQAQAKPDPKAVDRVRQEMWNLQDKMIKERREMARSLDGIIPPGQRGGFGRFGRRGMMGRYGMGGGLCGFGGGGCPFGPGGRVF